MLFGKRKNKHKQFDKRGNYLFPAMGERQQWRTIVLAPTLQRGHEVASQYNLEDYRIVLHDTQPDELIALSDYDVLIRVREQDHTPLDITPILATALLRLFWDSGTESAMVARSWLQHQASKLG